MSDEQWQLPLSHAELVSLYVELSRREADLDEVQAKVLGRIAAELYSRLSVAEMEDIEGYYRSLVPR